MYLEIAMFHGSDEQFCVIARHNHRGYGHTLVFVGTYDECVEMASCGNASAEEFFRSLLIV